MACDDPSVPSQVELDHCGIEIQPDPAAGKVSVTVRLSTEAAIDVALHLVSAVTRMKTTPTAPRAGLLRFPSSTLPSGTPSSTPRRGG
jgi:hypothetical protein